MWFLGWVYLEDISKIVEGEGNFTLYTSSRVLILQAPTKAEHRLWLQGIAERCPHASFENIQSSKRSLHAAVAASDSMSIGIELPHKEDAASSSDKGLKPSSKHRLSVDASRDRASHDSDRSNASIRSEVEKSPRRSQQLSHFSRSSDISEMDTGSRLNMSSLHASQQDESEDRISTPSKGSQLYDREDHRVVNRQGSHVGSGVSRRLNDHILHHEESKREAVQETVSRQKRAPRTEGGLFLARNEYSFETKTDEAPGETGVVRPISQKSPHRYARYLADSDEESGTSIS